MTDLPFELDEAELIEACLLVLRSAEPCAEAEAAARQRTGRPAQTEAQDPPELPRSWRLTGGAQSPLLLPEEQTLPELRAQLPPDSRASDAEAVSRAVERDARRYEA